MSLHEPPTCRILNKLVPCLIFLILKLFRPLYHFSEISCFFKKNYLPDFGALRLKLTIGYFFPTLSVSFYDEVQRCSKTAERSKCENLLRKAILKEERGSEWKERKIQWCIVSVVHIFTAVGKRRASMHSRRREPIL